MIKFNYLGDSVWQYGKWKVVGETEKGFQLYLFVFPYKNANESMVHIGDFESLCDIEQFLHFEANVA